MCVRTIGPIHFGNGWDRIAMRLGSNKTVNDSMMQSPYIRREKARLLRSGISFAGLRAKKPRTRPASGGGCAAGSRGLAVWGETEARPTVSDSNGVAKLNLIRPGHMSAMPAVVTHISAALTIGGPCREQLSHAGISN
jgi:hypothetical protein